MTMNQTVIDALAAAELPSDEVLMAAGKAVVRDRLAMTGNGASGWEAGIDAATSDEELLNIYRKLEEEGK